MTKKFLIRKLNKRRERKKHKVPPSVNLVFFSRSFRVTHTMSFSCKTLTIDKARTRHRRNLKPMWLKTFPQSTSEAFPLVATERASQEPLREYSMSLSGFIYIESEAIHIPQSPSDCFEDSPRGLFPNWRHSHISLFFSFHTCFKTFFTCFKTLYNNNGQLLRKTFVAKILLT